jgi:hypothetical protein
VLAASDVFAGAVYFTTYTPSTAVQCGGGSGTAKLYSLNLTAGTAAIALDTGGVLPDGTATTVGARTIGAGIPSRPVVIVDQNGNVGIPYVITGTTNQTDNQYAAPADRHQENGRLARGFLELLTGEDLLRQQ